MTPANLKSKHQYFVNKNGQVFNYKFELVVGTNLNGLQILNYLKEDGTKSKIPFTRLIYKTFYPKINISGCTITRLKLNVENQYSLYNLERISNKDMPKKLGIDLVQPSFNLSDRTFYKKFTEEEKQILFKELNNNKNTLSDLALKYNVSDMSIHRARKKSLI